MGMRGSMMTCEVLLSDSRGISRVYHWMGLVASVSRGGKQVSTVEGFPHVFTCPFRLHISVNLTYLSLDVARLMSSSCFKISGSSGWWISGQLQ